MAHIKTSIVISAARSKVFSYLTDPKNLPELLRDNVTVTLHNEDLALQVGSEFSFTMARYGISQPVRFYVEKLIPGITLSYRQAEGLFKSWVHTMRFDEHGEGSTLVTDMVEYNLPFGLIGHLLDDFILRRDLRNILHDRLKRAAEHFANAE